MDAARAHNSGRSQRDIEASGAERLLHPVYRPELVPNELFLSGYMKGKSYNYVCESREDLLNVITGIFTGVDQEVPLRVFESWVKGVQLRP
jgi:hypothetical protein